MRTIWKFQFRPTDEFKMEMPRGATILAVQLQGGLPCIWALVDPTAPAIDRHFALRGTGHDATGLEEARFVGTFQMMGGSLVFHLWERAA